MTRSQGNILLVCLFLPLLAAAGGWFGYTIRRHTLAQPIMPGTTVSFLNITSGQCTVIHTSDNRYILIDDGGSKVGDQVAKALRDMGAERIDLLILASPADSGLGGTAALLASKIPIRSAWINNATGSAERNRVETELETAEIPVRIVDSTIHARIGDSPAQLSVIWPPTHGARSHRDGIVCRLDYGAESCLFLGSIDSNSEAYLVSGAGDRLQADVLQVTDHGDGAGSSLEMLRRAQPQIAVISSFPTDPPEQAALDRLQAAGASIWRTDTVGTVTVTLDTAPNSVAVTGTQL